jgi:hypothetical protein
MPTTEELRTAVARIAANVAEILGSQLGLALTTDFPTLNLKVEYGGLRRFLQEHCSDIVVWRGKYHADDLYSPTKSGEPIAAVEQQERRASATLSGAATRATAWAAFSNPNIAAKLAVKPSTAELLIISHENESCPDDYRLIEKLTAEDYRHAAREYSLRVPQEDRAAFDTILDSEIFSWLNWSDALRSYEHGLLFYDWLAWRFNRICELFVDRVKAADVEERLLPVALANFKASKPTRVKSALSPQPQQALSSWRGSGLDLSFVRGVAQHAIAAMSEDDIRRLWLPLGMVLDAIQRPKQ